MAIGTSVADTTSNAGRALHFPAAHMAAGNGHLMETGCGCECVCPTAQAECLRYWMLELSTSKYSHMSRSILSTQSHTHQKDGRGRGSVTGELVFDVSQFLPTSHFWSVIPVSIF